MRSPHHIRFNPKRGFLATYHWTKEDLPTGEYHAMVRSNEEQIASYVLRTLNLNEIEILLKDNTEVQMVLKNDVQYKPTLKEDKLFLINEEEPEEEVIQKHMLDLAMSDEPVYNGTVDLSEGDCIRRLDIAKDWSIKLTARRSGGQSDIGEYLFFPTSKEACEAVWKGKMGTLTTRGLSDQQARNYIRYGLQVPYPYAEDIMNFVIHQTVEYGDLWTWTSPITMEEIDEVLSDQFNIGVTVNESRRWVAYNLLLATLGLDTLKRQ